MSRLSQRLAATLGRRPRRPLTGWGVVVLHSNGRGMIVPSRILRTINNYGEGGNRRGGGLGERKGKITTRGALPRAAWPGRYGYFAEPPVSPRASPRLENAH
jgi:hypothetical protein